MNKKISRDISIFVFVVIISGWLGVLVDKLIPEQPEGDTLGMLLWLVLPFITVVIIKLITKDSWKEIELKPRFKDNVKWYIVSLLIFPIVTIITLSVGKIFGLIDTVDLNINKFLMVFIGGIVFAIIKNFFEESVWRGFLTTKLNNLKIKDYWLYIIVGFVWGIWHLPYYLVFLSDETMNLFVVCRLAFAMISIITMIAWAIMYVEMYLITKSIWSVVLIHAIEDAFVNPLILDGYVKIVGINQFLVSPIFGVIATILYLCVGLSLRKARKKLISNSITN